MCKGPGAGEAASCTPHGTYAAELGFWAESAFPRGPGGGQFCGEGCSHVLRETGQALWQKWRRLLQGCASLSPSLPLPLCPHTLTNTDTSIKLGSVQAVASGSTWPLKDLSRTGLIFNCTS